MTLFILGAFFIPLVVREILLARYPLKEIAAKCSLEDFRFHIRMCRIYFPLSSTLLFLPLIFARSFYLGLMVMFGAVCSVFWDYTYYRLRTWLLVREGKDLDATTVAAYFHRMMQSAAFTLILLCLSIIAGVWEDRDYRKINLENRDDGCVEVDERFNATWQCGDFTRRR